MNSKRELNRLQGEQADPKHKIDAVEKQLKLCREFTAQLLAECQKAGIKKVAIQVAHKSVKSSTTFPFGPQGSVFTDDAEINGWPAIWHVAEKVGIFNGCGNHNQASVKAALLVDGVYHLKDGQWKKVD